MDLRNTIILRSDWREGCRWSSCSQFVTSLMQSNKHLQNQPSKCESSKPGQPKGEDWSCRLQISRPFILSRNKSNFESYLVTLTNVL